MTTQQLIHACRLSAGTIASATGLPVEQIQSTNFSPEAQAKIEEALRPERAREMKYVNPYNE